MSSCIFGNFCVCNLAMDDFRTIMLVFKIDKERTHVSQDGPWI